jgi:prevent-host-death family protein
MPSPARKRSSRTRRRPARKTHPAEIATVVNVHEAKTQLSRLLVRVERGERIIIARAGKPVAVIAPPAQTERPAPMLDDPLLRVDEYAVDGPGGKLTAREIDRIAYGI